MRTRQRRSLVLPRGDPPQAHRPSNTVDAQVLGDVPARVGHRDISWPSPKNDYSTIRSLMSKFSMKCPPRLVADKWLSPWSSCVFREWQQHSGLDPAVVAEQKTFLSVERWYFVLLKSESFWTLTHQPKSQSSKLFYRKLLQLHHLNVVKGIHHPPILPRAAACGTAMLSIAGSAFWKPLHVGCPISRWSKDNVANANSVARRVMRQEPLR